jgi:hypothetical protein
MSSPLTAARGKTQDASNHIPVRGIRPSAIDRATWNALANVKACPRNLKINQGRRFNYVVYFAAPKRQHDRPSYDIAFELLKNTWDWPSAEFINNRDLYSDLRDWERKFPSIAPRITVFAALLDEDDCIGAGVYRELSHVTSRGVTPPLIVAVRRKQGRLEVDCDGSFVACKPFNFQQTARFVPNPKRRAA